jgi:CheY-like chemotaxis protein
MPQKVILYVEDEESDVCLMEMALRMQRVDVTLKCVMDGESAMNYLSGTGRYANRQDYPCPGLVLLDLNIPRVHGLKVLKWIREQANLATLPVVIYTSSEQPRDVNAAQQAGANDYQVKPSTIEAIADTVRRLLDCWVGDKSGSPRPGTG